MQVLLGRGVEHPVARQAHNLKVTGSNPVPATNLSKVIHPFLPLGQDLIVDMARN